jgi:arylsulfate sulfotransferase
VFKVGRTCVLTTLGFSLLSAAVAVAATKSPSVSITLSPSVPNPAMLGTHITWTATVTGGPPGDVYDYQFSAAPQGQNQIVRDFALPNSFVWVPWQVEGTYAITVVVRDITQQPYIVYPPVTVQYVLNPWVTAPGGSLVNPTNHPLVALFSAGPCTVGHSIRVRFQNPASVASSTTNTVACSSKSANFLVAGMLPSSHYLMHWEELSGAQLVRSGTQLSFATGPLSATFPPDEHFTVNIPASPHDSAFPVILFHLIPAKGQTSYFWPTATDVGGHVIWYYPAQALITRMQPGGFFFTMNFTDLTEYDLAGNEVLHTDVEILNEQLAAKGYPQMTSFNDHETRVLPNSNILILGGRDETSTVYQGGTPDDPVDIIGDMILVLDHNMQLLWAWDSFAHQDLSREATLDDKCFHGTGGCPFFNPNFTVANDWTHANALQYTTDGNILISERSQDWALKINYANGAGDGSVIWRMGPYGDFTVVNPPGGGCGDPNVFPWFTHQHDPSFQTQGGPSAIMTVFDDGNLRVQQCGSGNSRGMVLDVNESAHQVFIQTLADLGHYSLAVGAAQLLVTPQNGIFASFDNGFLIRPTAEAQVSETDLAGNIVFQIQANDWSYRAYRQRDLYTPTLP